MHNRTVFFVSDGTGITAETFGKAILAQFEAKVRQIRLPFVDTADKAHQAVRQINHAASQTNITHNTMNMLTIHRMNHVKQPVGIIVSHNNTHTTL